MMDPLIDRMSRDRETRDGYAYDQYWDSSNPKKTPVVDYSSHISNHEMDPTAMILVGAIVVCIAGILFVGGAILIGAVMGTL